MAKMIGIDLDKDYYSILEIGMGAPPKEIKKAYRKLCVKYHPDTTEMRNVEMAAEMFIEVTNAYRVLSNDEMKAFYDARMKARRRGDAEEVTNEPPEPEETVGPEMSVPDYIDLLVEQRNKEGLRWLTINEEYPPENREAAGIAYVEIEEDKVFLRDLMQKRWVPDTVIEAAGLKYVELEDDLLRLMSGVHRKEFPRLVEEAAGLKYVELESSDAMLQSVAKFARYPDVVREAAGIKYIEGIGKQETLGKIVNDCSFPQTIRDVAAIKYAYTGNDRTYLPYLTKMLQYGKLPEVAKEMVGLMCVELETDLNQLTWYIRYRDSPQNVREAAALKYVELEDNKGQLRGILNNDDFLPLVKAAGVKCVELEDLDIELSRISGNQQYPKVVREAAAQRRDGADINSMREKHTEFIKRQRTTTKRRKQKGRQRQKT